METGSAMAGEIAGLLKEVLPAKVLIERLFSEAEAVAKQLTIKY